MKRIARLGLALAIAAGGVMTAATAPAAAAGCEVSVTYNTSAIWVRQTPSGCQGQMRSVLYYFISPNGGTTYSTRGSWVSNGSTSEARTTPDRYFGGIGRDWR